jgi:hypothetical protein
MDRSGHRGTSAGSSYFHRMSRASAWLPDESRAKAGYPFKLEAGNGFASVRARGKHVALITSVGEVFICLLSER